MRQDGKTNRKSCGAGHKFYAVSMALPIDRKNAAVIYFQRSLRRHCEAGKIPEQKVRDGTELRLVFWNAVLPDNGGVFSYKEDRKWSTGS